MPFKKGKYRQKLKGKLGRYHATRRGTSVVQTAPAAASSSSAAADRVGDNRGGSGASGIDESNSAEAIADGNGAEASGVRSECNAEEERQGDSNKANVCEGFKYEGPDAETVVAEEEVGRF